MGITIANIFASKGMETQQNSIVPAVKAPENWPDRPPTGKILICQSDPFFIVFRNFVGIRSCAGFHCRTFDNYLSDRADVSFFALGNRNDRQEEGVTQRSDHRKCQDLPVLSERRGDFLSEPNEGET